MNVVLLFFFAALAILIARLFMLQIVEHKEYQALAARQHRLVKDILPERGTIYAHDKAGKLIPLALNRVHKNLVASPKIIENPDEISDFIIQNFEVQKDDVIQKITKKNDQYEVLIKKIDAVKADELERKLPRGLFFEEEKRRIYPYGSLGSNLLGFVSIEKQEEVGRYGLERFYQKDLAGKRGFLEGAKDAAGFWVALARRILNPPEHGSHVALTVDYNIQRKAEEVLKNLSQKWSPSSALILVLEPATGKIISEVVNPSFDPNEFSKVRDYSQFLNLAVESMFELGSVLKPVTMAAGIEEGVVNAETTYEDTGEVKISGYTIKNFDNRAHGTQTMTQVLEQSLNTGAVFVARKLGHEKQLQYLKKFGFGEKTGVDMPGELSGDISHLAAGRDIDFATASFGQGIAVTPIQLASAIAAIANKGVLMEPYIVERIFDSSGNEVKNTPQEKRRVISSETAEIITKMLISTVKSGFDNRAGVKGYFVAGKTGTAQIPRKDGRGYSDQVIHTFVGYAPAFDPKFMIIFQMNEPLGNRFAANTLTPAFHDLAEYILNYYEIPPDEK